MQPDRIKCDVVKVKYIKQSQKHYYQKTLLPSN